ncbi:hypothetical protein B0T16DRAFT_455526 [Cercophora newfieldiana]|uniref:Uncharacterized protein n=1 Tax=Cercophora newfieldiana TaxID=92897 RepID=A0AA40CR17_9PEZI|nr:hypothetical protein B0T16DRAFT_455526 [Cercophora newfieldiana]
MGDFGKLQTINITHLLNQLARIKAKVEHDKSTNAEDMELLQRTLHQYDHIKARKTDHTTRSTGLSRKKLSKSTITSGPFLRKALPSHLSSTEEERRVKRPQYEAGETPEVYSSFVDAVARFLIGTVGGCALIVPMMIMVLHPSLVKSVVVVSVAVVS